MPLPGAEHPHRRYHAASVDPEVGPSHEPFFAPSLDLTVHFLEDTTSEWLLTLVHARRARAGYASADAEIWDDRGCLIALATQTMLLRRAPGPLPFTE